MIEKFVNINGVPTLIAMLGETIDSDLTKVDEIAILLVGNPGLPHFYYSFIEELYEKLDKKIPVWSIGGAGHNYPPDPELEMPKLRGNERKYDLQGQTENKIEFILRFIPDNVKINLIGHSMGSLYTLEMIRNPELKKRLKHCYLLFPVIERMGEAPRAPGFIRTYIDRYLLMKIIFTFFYIFPNFMKNAMMSAFFAIMNYPKNFRTAYVNYLNPNILEKSVFLSKDVIDNYKTVDYEFIEKNKKNLTFFYGARDGWVPIKYYNDLKYNVTDIDAVLDETNMPHTFVFKKNNKMSKIVGDWIQGRNYNKVIE